VGKGVLHALGCSAILAALAGLAFLPVLLGWGLLQWNVLLPLYFFERSKQRKLAAKGVLLTGLVVFLLQAACYGLVIVSIGRNGMH
jgi:hypothetical protein